MRVEGFFSGRVWCVFGVSFPLAEGMEMRGVSCIAALTILRGNTQTRAGSKLPVEIQLTMKTV